MEGDGEARRCDESTERTTTLHRELRGQRQIPESGQGAESRARVNDVYMYMLYITLGNYPGHHSMLEGMSMHFSCSEAINA